MASTEIHRITDESGDNLRVIELSTATKFRMTTDVGTSFIWADPKDVVGLRDALSALIERRGWGA